MTAKGELEPTRPERVQAFAVFFKNYMSLSSVVAAALPIPVTALNLIPTFAYQTRMLGVYTSMFCFLLLAFIFYSRHYLARIMFPFERPHAHTAEHEIIGRRVRGALILWLPLVLILSSLGCVIGYHTMLNQTLLRLEIQFGANTTPGDAAKAAEGAASASDAATNIAAAEKHDIEESAFDKKILQLATPSHLGDSGPILLTFYLGIFLFAEAAFILMAIKEYLQDKLGMDDMDMFLEISPFKLAAVHAATGPVRRKLSRAGESDRAKEPPRDKEPQEVE